MAIISIPTSIGGVTIPGTATKGPLGALFDSKYKIANYQYPRDLGSSTKGHAVKFTINEIQPISYGNGPNTKNLSNSIGNVFEKIKSGGSSEILQAGNQAWEDLKTVGNEIIKNNNINLSLTKRKTRQGATIALYMPDTVNFQYTPQYNNLGLRNTLIKAIPSATAQKVVTAAIQSDITRLALATQGLALNPLNQLLFDTIDFRTYQLAFTFTPYSQQEAEDVKKIIREFKEAALPRITDAAFGMFFIPPSTFNIDFLYNGKTNTGISRVAESVIESIDVNYAPNGWAAHTDGAPVQTTLTMNFREIELIDQKKIAQGY